MNYLFRTAVAAFVCLSIFACSKGNDKASNIDPRTGKHPADWAVANTGGAHAVAFLSVPSSCYQCHGKDLTGGISTVSCFTASRSGMTCHASGPSGHPAGWKEPDQHGAHAKALLAGTNGLAHCQVCHGADFSGGLANKTCFNTAGCHGVGVMAPHAKIPWRDVAKTGALTHTSTDTSNAAACAACHANGANSTRKPLPAAPAGTAPGCFNNTLCHGMEGHADGWRSYSSHGRAAKAAAGGITIHGTPSPISSFSSCTSCHGTNYAGGTAGQSCINVVGCHGATVAAPHPQRPWFSTTGGVTHTDTDSENAGQCATCHTGGANSTRKPRAGDPVGITSCFNNTLCHGTVGHVAGWSAAGLHGAAAKSAPTATTGFSACQSCHGSTFNNGTPPGCMNVAGCHGLFVSSPHPAKPWTSTVSGVSTHTTTDIGNVGICAACHTAGANSDVKPPAAASGTAGCFNNTLCHFHTIPFAPPTVAPAVHGGLAKQDLRVCKTCHGSGTNSFNGGTTTTSCASCHTFAKAHPTAWQGSTVSPGGSVTYSHRTAGNTATACALCHNVSSTVGTPLAGAPSCLAPTFTNGLGNNTGCHPSGPGVRPHAKPYANHNATARNNFGYCLGCHQVAVDSTTAGGVVIPRCLTCHLTDPTVTATGCTSCHANPPNGSSYPNIAAVHAGHLTAGTISNIALTCADCHNGLGLATVDHQVRAKARAAAVMASPVVFSANSLIAGSSGTAPAFTGGASGQCTNTYCHGAKMPGGDITGSNPAPAWNNASYLTGTIADCGVCHGFPPTSASGHDTIATPTTFAQIGSLCAGCHSDLNASASSYATIFSNKAQHIDGTLQAANGHGFPYSGALHKAATGAANGTGCLSASCHIQGTNASPYPIAGAVGTRKPACRACHLNANPGTDPQCSDCHGSINSNGIALDAGRPTGNTFPNRGGSSDGHSRSNHHRTCTTCHLFTTGDIRHGWSNGAPRSTSAQMVPALNWSPGSRAANTGTCNPSAGGFSGCHSSKTGWY